MVALDTTTSKDCVFRGAAIMMVRSQQARFYIREDVWEPLADLGCACSFRKALSAVQLIDSGYFIRPMMDFIDQISRRQLDRSQIVSQLFVTKLLTAQIISRYSQTGVQFPYFPDKIRMLNHCWPVLGHMRNHCSTGSVSVVKSRLSRINMQAALNRACGAFSKRLDI